MKNMQAFKTVILLLWIWNNISHLASHLLARTLNQNKYMSLPSSQDPLKYECIKVQNFILNSEIQSPYESVFKCWH